MSTSARRSAAIKISSILAFAVGGALWGQQQPIPPAGTTTAPTTAPATAATRPLPGVDLTKTMSWRFVNVPVDAVLNEMSSRFGFVIVVTSPLPTARITVQNPQEVDAQG